MKSSRYRSMLVSRRGRSTAHLNGRADLRRLGFETLEDRRMLAQIVGVDFDVTGSTKPTNWNLFDFDTDGLISNLTAENGVDTPFDLSVVATGSSNGIQPFIAGEAIAASTLPSHSPSLAELEGLLFAEVVDTESVSITATWKDLAPGTTYELYVFGLDADNNSSSHAVTINGVPAFTNSPNTSGPNSNLWINGQQGDNRPLEDFAVTAIADGSGEIQIVATPTSSAVALGGLAIREVGYVVNSTGDIDDGAPGNGVTTLREAINLSNAAAGENTITFDSSVFATPQTILLAGQLPTITDGLTITGPGHDLLTLNAGDGADGQFGTGDGFRIFKIDNGDNNAEIDVELGGLTLTGGDVEGTFESVAAGQGAAILNRENLVLRVSTISGNATGGGSFDNGGGIFHSNGELLVAESTISENSARSGGGIFLADGTATINRSTISGNSASSNGGGIRNGDELTILGSTISGNSAFSGGGIHNGEELTIHGSTVFGNAASNGQGGGIFNSLAGSPSLSLTNTIVANSTSGGDLTDSSLVPVLSGSFNLIGDGSHLGALTNSIQGDALLGPLADNGGPTQTHALLPGSPVLDMGSPSEAYYPFEGNANDIAGANDGTNNGAILNAPTEVLGSTTAAEFDGVDDFVQLDSLLEIGDSSHTVEVWVNVPAAGTGTLGPNERVGVILGNFLTTSSITANWEIHDNGEMRIFWDSGSAIDMRGSTDLRGTGWRHLTFVRDKSEGEFRAYIDGQPESLTNSSSSAGDLTFTEIHRIGNDNRDGSGIPFHGALDELAIWDRALSSEEIAMRALGNIDQRGRSRIVDGDAISGARFDIGAYEAQIAPSADFDSDGDVDGADFLAWQRGFGKAEAVRADGNSDDDADVDASDLAAWGVSFGQPQPLTAPVVSRQGEVDSGAIAGLVDAAMALELSSAEEADSASPFVATVFSQENFVSNVSALDQVAPLAVEENSQSAQRSESPQTDDLPWLADELLERVFG